MARLAFKPAIVEKLALRLCRFASENFVSMRKTSKRPNDVVMALSVLQIWRAKRLVLGERNLLIGQILRVRKRQVEKDAQIAVYVLVKTCSERLSRNLTRQWIRCANALRAAKAITRKLIEQQQ